MLQRRLRTTTPGGAGALLLKDLPAGEVGRGRGRRGAAVGDLALGGALMEVEGGRPVSHFITAAASARPSLFSTSSSIMAHLILRIIDEARSTTKISRPDATTTTSAAAAAARHPPFAKVVVTAGRVRRRRRGRHLRRHRPRTRTCARCLTTTTIAAHHRPTLKTAASL